MLKLYIGNKNYSSWSMRPWVMLREAGIPFEEVMVRFDDMQAGSAFKQTVTQLSPAARVPFLTDGDLVIWDTLAIAEYVNEYAAAHHPDALLWPTDRLHRARARSICAEMHSGFSALRNACTMNLEASLLEAGAIVWRDQPAVRADVARLVSMWSELLGTPPLKTGEHFLFGQFSIADAYFAPVCARLKTYGLPVPAHITRYVDRVFATRSVKAWLADALQEHDFVAFDEPYRLAP